MIDDDEPRLVYPLTSPQLQPREAKMSDEEAQEALQPAGSLGESDPSYEAVVGDVATIIASARNSAARSVNAALTAAY